MEYNKNKLITDDGVNLVSQSLQEGQKVTFDAMIITDTPLPSDRQLSAMTVDNFKNVRKYPITNLKKGNNSVQPEAKLDNNGLTTDYPIHAIGLLAHVGESNSTLFGITQNSEGTPAIITKQSQTPYFITYDMAITVTNPDNYTATITPAGYVDQTTFDEEIGKIQTSIKNIDLSDAVKKANNYTNSVKDDLQHNIDTTNQRVDTVHDQLGGDIASAKSELSGQIGELSDKSLKFFSDKFVVNDFNNYDQTGIYPISGSTPNNHPNEEVPSWGYYGFLQVKNYSSGNAYQELYDLSGYNSGFRHPMFYRYRDVGNWHEWQTIATTDDTDKLSDKINDLSNNNPSIFAGWLQDGDDLFDLMEKEGTFFDFNKQLKNSPVNYTVWSKIIVDKNNGFTSMTWYDSSGNIFYINATGWPKNWNSWQRIVNNNDIAALSDRIDKAQEQIGSDIRDAEQRAKDDANKKIQFFNNETDAHNANLPAGTLKIVRG
ncbi:pyocin knob domain-containing protein [Apilactobacillus micheneri]|uniref:pyocin knob domain-containing protein n=1 Tax=Apilactobacillus micheneri TaxID=1899430 RepID=UPI000D0306A2|nr:pyocin knob domain-containing protein [Apilactobacillus micheneri]